MARRRSANKSSRSRKRRIRLPLFISKVLPDKRTRARWFKLYTRSSPYTQLFVVTSVVLITWLLVNVIYQVIRKPTELFFPVSGTLYKSPAETWRAYAPIFKKHSTAVITPELLAALAQVEGSGNPIVRTYWRWSFTHKPFDVYKPASSAVGMYQITDGTFDEMRRLCIHDHQVVEDGPWHDWRSCWFNWLYFRVVPSHAMEMTSAYLDRSVANTVVRYPRRNITLKQKQTLATLIHLCGAGAGRSYAARGYQLSQGQRCGDHGAAGYVSRVSNMQTTFAKLAADS